MADQQYSEQIKRHYYEGDQSKLYSGIMNPNNGHSIDSDHSKHHVSAIWKVFWILLVVTIVEVIMGMFFSHHLAELLVIFIFLSLTLYKAARIVSVFMHLGDEVRQFLITVLIPLTFFIWFIIAFLADGHFWQHMNKTTPTRNTQEQLKNVN